MAEILTAHVLNAPAQLQEYLAARLTGDPGRDADALEALLKEGQVARLCAKERLASLETVWPSAVDALNQIEQRIASSSIPLSSHVAGMAAAHFCCGSESHADVGQDPARTPCHPPH